MLNMLKSLMCLIAAEPCSAVSHGQSFLAAMSPSLGWIVIKNVFLWLWNWILSLIWIIEKFVLGIMDALQAIVYEFLGIGTTVDDYLNFATKNDATKILVDTFKAILAVAIVLMIIFTIVAIIRQEIETATNAKGKGNEETNKKGPIVMKLFKGIMSAILLPFAMIAIIGAVNSVLTAFNNALQGENQTTIAGQVLATSTYDVNKYRQYANNNKRVPVLIEAYNVDDYGADQKEELVYKIKSVSVQEKLINTATDINKNLLLSFNESLTYENNKLTNNSKYADYYESFVCTAEQYQVMADFIDYCELTNTNFYIKAIDDNDIEWKYVDSSVFDAANMSLNITYRDANDLDGDGKTNDTYTVSFSMGFDVTSPISNALDSISALLGLNQYGDMKYNEMERDPNSINMVQWANEKVSLHFSYGFKINDMSTWTPADEILMYEYYHFSSNNSLADYSFSDLSYENRGNATLDAYKIVYRDYYPDAGAFSSEKVIYVVYINGSYYKIKKSETEVDSYGNKFYVLDANEDAKFLEKGYTILSEEPEKAELKFVGKQGNFSLNNPSTWSYTDQILIYEYYKDLSYNNTFSNYNISDLGKGIQVSTYKIRDYDAAGNETENRYVLLNGTYYLVSAPSSGSNYVLTGSTSSSNFLESIEDKYLTTYYNYVGSNGNAIKIEDIRGEFGISTNTTTNKTANDFIIDSDDGVIFTNLERNINYVLSEEIEFNLKYTSGFDYRDVDTWSYKDYFLFYLYAKYLNNSSLTVDSLKYTPLPGIVGKFNGKTYYKIQSQLTENNSKYKTVYLCVDDINNISTQNIKNVINEQTTLENNRFSTNDDLAFTLITDPYTVFSKVETEIRDFTFSSNVSFENVNEWKMRDYILFLLDSRGIIGLPANFENYQYNSVVYKGVSIGANLTSNLYSFGSGDKTIYLNENYLVNLGYNDFDEFLDTKLITFIAKRLSNSSNGEIKKLLLEREDLISNIANSDAYNSNTHVFASLVNALINIYGFGAESADKILDIYNDLSTYTYTNSNFIADDLSTYTIFDLAIYLFTGRATGRYNNYIANVNGEMKYIIGDYAVSISNSSIFSSTISQESYVTSGAVNLGGQSLTEYYKDSGLSSKVLMVSKGENSLSHANNLDYIFVSDAVNGNYTNLDVIIAGLNLTQKVSYELYTNGVSNYLLLGEKDNTLYYLTVDNFNMDNIASLSTNSTISLNSNINPFVVSGTYNSFSGSTGSNNYNLMDSVIFELTNNTSPASYRIYTSSLLGGKSYISIDGTFVEYNSSIVNFDRLASGYNDYEDLVDILINNYYNSYVVGNIGSTTGNTNISYNVSDFDLEDINTYTPLRLILNKIGVTSDVSGYLTRSANRLYFVIRLTDINGKVTTYNINVTDFLDADGNDIQSEIVKLRYRAALCYQTSGAFKSPSEIIDDLENLNQNIENAISSYVVSSYTSNPLNFTKEMTEEDISSWNWLDIAHYYVFGTFRTTNDFVLYSDVEVNGNERYLYVGLNSGGTTRFVRFASSILSADGTVKLEDFDSGNRRVSFSLDSDSSLLGLLYYKYTGSESGSVNYAKIGSGEDARRIYSILDQNTGSYVFYIGYEDQSKESSINSVVSANSYTYNLSATTENLYTWNLLDLLIKAADGNLSNKAYNMSSRIYMIDGNRYMLVNGYYINIDLVGATLSEKLQDGSTTEYIRTIEKTRIPSAESFFGYSSNTINDVNSSSAFNYGFIRLRASNVSKKTNPLVTDSTTGNIIASNEVKLYFSEGFDFSDYSSWKNSDFMLYYLFKTGHMDSSVQTFQYYVNLGYVPATMYALESYDNYGSVTINKVYKVGEGECNFGSFANLNASSIEAYRNSVSSDVFNSFIRNIADYNFINYNIWQLQYERQLTNIFTQSNSDADLFVSIDGKPVTNPGIGTFGISITTDINARDFIYNNYYYFNVNTEDEELVNLRVSTSISDSLNDSTETKIINLKLSEGFDINDISTWTILDYIIVREYAYDHSNSTIFGNCEFEELKQDFLIKVYVIKGADGDRNYLMINGHYYNITDAQDGVTGKLTNAVSKSDLINDGYSYSFKLDAGELYYDLSRSREQISRELVKSNDSLVYNLTVDDKTYTYFRKIDSNLERVYRVSLTTLDTYKISVMVRDVNWVQKLMNDMQVIYPDLNWANLIATNGWFDTLGEYHSSYASGQFVASGNTANITAAGMVLSEFLLSIANTSYAGFAEYEYSSVFDEDVINALMLAMLGEQKYETLKIQAKVFVEMFNVGFAQILDDVAAERGLNIVDGEVSNLTMSIYKSYLASILLSSDLGEYLYTIATRVYSQYAIYETLAFASGDYANYYAYINGFADETGKVVDAFKYATFRELVEFENTSLKDDAVPVYTFNYYAVYRAIINSNASKAETNLSLHFGELDALVEWAKTIGITEQQLKNRGYYKTGYTEKDIRNLLTGLGLNNVFVPVSYDTLISKLNAEYETKYTSYRGSTDRFNDNDESHFSYMLHVYWSIRQDLKNRMILTSPVYLRIYEDYIYGNIDRWEIECDMTINASSSLIQYYDIYKLLLQTKKFSYLGSYLLAYFPNLVFTLETEEDYDQFVEDFTIGNYSIDANSMVYRLKEIFPSSTTYGKILNKVFASDTLSPSDIILKTKLMFDSEEGKVSSWNTIVQTRDNIEALLSELADVMDLAVGEKTPNGSIHVNFTQNVYSETYNSLSSIYEKLNDYIGTQNTIDKIEKASITFTLAQFSNNYVESGFEFTIRNKVYTLDTAISAQRLAEYVYGGAYLDQFGVYAQYTSPTFTGIIHPTKAVDTEDGNRVKTKLNCFTELREFAGSIADYTAKLYFLTNLKDLSDNVSDSMLLTEELYATNGYIGAYFGNSGGSYKTSLEYLILDHIVAEEEIYTDTLLRLIFGDTEDSLNRMNCSDIYITLLEKFLSGSTNYSPAESEFINNNKNNGLIKVAENGSIASLSEEFIRLGLRRYLVYIQTTDSNIKTINTGSGYTYLTGGDIEGYYGLYQPNGYNSHGYYGEGYTASDRIHIAFKNVISYLTISEEQKEGDIDLGIEGKTVDLDGMTFKDLKSYLIDSLVDYQKNEGEGAENAARYLTLFNLISGQFNYMINEDGKGLKSIGTTLSSVNKDKQDGSNLVKYKNEIIYQGNDYGTKSTLYASFNIDRSTRGTILKLCGIENRPIEELVKLEYDELYQRNGSYDEAKGDVFILCSYDDETGKYVPFLASNSKYSGSFGGTNYMDYINDYGHRIFTDYYDSEYGVRFAYPIIAKGIVTPDLKPTAIKIEDNVAKFYRTDITATAKVEESALQKVNASVETTTVGYVQYVNVSSFNNIQSKNEGNTMFIGSSDIMSYINSDASVYYVQYTNVYNISKADGFDGISVLDSFSAFFNMSIQMHLLMVLAFITLVPLLFNASGAVLRRILDLILLVLAGPLCISMNSLKHTDEEQQAYSQWKKYMFSTLLSVFGLIISFNLYFIMISIVMNMNFVSAGDSTMERISMIGGLNFVTAPILNAAIRIIFVVVATNIIENAADMLLNMLTGGKANSSFKSALGGETIIKSLGSLKDSMVKDIRTVTSGARDVINGKILIEAKNAVVESLPGVQVVRGAVEGVGNVNNYLKSRELYKKARAKGINPLVARAAAKEYRNNYKKQRDEINKRRQQYAQSFYGRMGLNYGGGKK